MKNLLITGGSQGIGKLALEAAKKGMFIGINYNLTINLQKKHYLK